MRSLVLVALLLACIVYAQQPGVWSTKEVSAFTATAPDFLPVFILDKNLNVRKELYLGDQFYIIFCLKNFEGNTNVDVWEYTPFGTNEMFRGTLQGGFCYYFSLRIVEPIVEGGIYTVRVDACDSSRCGSGSVSWVERDHPIATISSVKVREGGRDVSTLLVSGRYNVVVSVRNTGEIDYNYRVVVKARSGAFESSGDVRVGAGSVAEISIEVVPQSFPQGFKDQLVVQVYGREKLDGERVVNIEIIPPRAGPFRLLSPGSVELRDEVVGDVVFVLENTGYSGRVVGVAVTPSFPANVSYHVVGADFAPGGRVEVRARVTPRGPYYESSGAIALVLEYESLSGERYRDEFYINATVYVRVAGAALLTGGAPVPTYVPCSVYIGGACGQGERWLVPGVYTLRAGDLELEKERYIFVRWGGVVSGGAREVVLRIVDSAEIYAFFDRYFRVRIEDPVVKSFSDWVKEGVSIDISRPSHVPISEGERWAFSGWGGNCAGERVVVDRPIECTAMWIKEYRVNISALYGGGRPVPASCLVEIGGKCVDGVAWLAPGEYEVKARGSVQTGEGVKFEFESWSDGVGSASRSLNVRGPVSLAANYVRYFFIEIVDPVGGRGTTGWIREGVVVDLSQPDEVPIDYGSKWKFMGWSGGCVGDRLMVDRPARCEALWKRQYRIVLSVLLDGRQVGGGEWWMYEGDTLQLSAISHKPGGEVAFLIRVLFDKWVVNGRETGKEEISTVVNSPIETSLYWHRDYTGVILAGAAPVAGLGVVYRNKLATITKTITQRVRKTRVIEISEVKDETRVYGEEDKEEDKKEK